MYNKANWDETGHDLHHVSETYFDLNSNSSRSVEENHIQIIKKSCSCQAFRYQISSSLADFITVAADQEETTCL